MNVGPPTSNSSIVRIATIRNAVTIFDVLAEFGHEFEPVTQQVRCPFHDDHSPSARIYADQNKVYCFTEQKSWDVIDAAATKLGCGLHEAMTWIEQQFHVPGAIETLQGTIRTQLTSRVAPDIQSAAGLVETKLRRNRRALGYEKYTRLLYALDLSVWECQQRVLKPAQFQERLGQLLALGDAP